MISVTLDGEPCSHQRHEKSICIRHVGDKEHADVLMGDTWHEGQIEWVKKRRPVLVLPP